MGPFLGGQGMLPTGSGGNLANSASRARTPASMAAARAKNKGSVDKLRRVSHAEVLVPAANRCFPFRTLGQGMLQVTKKRAERPILPASELPIQVRDRVSIREFVARRAPYRGGVVASAASTE